MSEPTRMFEPVEPQPPAPVPRRPRWLVPALVGVLVVVILLAAYLVGRAFSPSPAHGTTAGTAPRGTPYGGPVADARIEGVTASCTAAPGVDGAGNEVSYDAGNVGDGDLATAWRCDGDGTGVRLTLTLPKDTPVGEVGLVPGYAKTDPRSGVDRYAENNRITRVRWRFPDGTAVEQRLDPAPDRRGMQTVRIPVVRTGQVVLEVLATARGPRDTTAISEVRVGRAS